MAPVVLVHGNPEVASVWGALVDSLTGLGAGDVTALSPPGFGAPTPPGWDPTPAAYVAWLVGELEGLGGPAHLVGHDWGSGHVLGVLAERPDLVASWTVDVAGLVHPDHEWHDLARTWQADGEGEESVAMFQALPDADLAAAYEGSGVTAPVALEMARAFDAAMGRCILGLYRGAARPFMAELGDRVAAAPRRPGLVVDAADDPYVPSALSRQMAARLGADVVTLPGQGHWWMATDPAPAARAMVEHWAAAEAG